MSGQILSIARNTFVESIRQPIFILLILLSGVAQFLTTWSTGFAMGTTTSAEVSGDNKLLLDIGLSTVFVVGMLLAAFVATAVVSREIDNKTILTVVSKPVGRPAVIIGKYLGVSGALLIATVTMLAFLLLAIRHGVMSTAADDPDGPVLLFGFLAVLLSLGLGAVCNYLYGWPFSQTSVLLLLPLILLAYVLVLMISPRWAWQPLATDLKPGVLTASYALVLAILVLSAVATAASTRLGQVMTIVVCAGVFVMGLLSNYFVGRYAFQNDWVAMIRQAEPAHPTQAPFLEPGNTYEIAFERAPDVNFRPGMSFYYGANPNGFALAVPEFPPFTGDVARSETLFGQGVPAGVIVTAASEDRVTIRNIGARGLRVDRPPEAGDFVFAGPTSVNPVAAVVWSVLPNMHYFWLADPIGMNVRIPLGHVETLTAYTAAQVVFFLALGVILFQKRDVG